MTGRVTAADGGQPIAGARVEATVSGRMAGSATTNESGQFRIVNLGEGLYSVTAARIGYQLQRVEGVRVETGIVTADFALLAPSRLFLCRANSGGLQFARVFASDLVGSQALRSKGEE